MSFRLEEFDLQLIRECPGLLDSLSNHGLKPEQVDFIQEADPSLRREKLKQGTIQDLGTADEEKALLRKALSFAIDRRYPRQKHSRAYDGEPKNLLGKHGLARIDAECLMLEAEELRLIGLKNRAKAAGMKHSTAEFDYSLGVKKADFSSKLLERVIKEFLEIGVGGLELRWIVNYEIESLGNSLQLQTSEIRALEAQARAEILRVENSKVQSGTGQVGEAGVKKLLSSTRISDKEVYCEAKVSRQTFQTWKRGDEISAPFKARIERAVQVLNYSR